MLRALLYWLETTLFDDPLLDSVLQLLSDHEQWTVKDGWCLEHRSGLCISFKDGHAHKVNTSNGGTVFYQLPCIVSPTLIRFSRLARYVLRGKILEMLGEKASRTSFTPSEQKPAAKRLSLTLRDCVEKGG